MMLVLCVNVILGGPTTVLTGLIMPAFTADNKEHTVTHNALHLSYHQTCGETQFMGLIVKSK